MAQVYPPDNGKGPYSFRRWYPDDITGIMHPETDLVRDHNGRLRYKYDVDKLGKDELALTHYIRPEENPPDP